MRQRNTLPLSLAKPDYIGSPWDASVHKRFILVDYNEALWSITPRYRVGVEQVDPVSVRRREFLRYLRVSAVGSKPSPVGRSWVIQPSPVCRTVVLSQSTTTKKNWVRVYSPVQNILDRLPHIHSCSSFSFSNTADAAELIFVIENLLYPFSERRADRA